MAIIILWRTGVLDPAAEDVVARVAAEKGSTLYPGPDKGATLNYPFLV